MKRRAIVRLSWVLGLVLLDLVTKSVVFAWVGELDAAGELVRDHDGHRRYPLLGTEWFAFMLSTNPGAAFGQLGNIPHLLVALRIACVFLLGTWLLGVEGGRRASTTALVLVLAGAAGNLYDNLMLGDSGAAMAAHIVIFLVFGASWCLGSTNTRWGVTGLLLGTALSLELGLYKSLAGVLVMICLRWAVPRLLVRFAPRCLEWLADRERIGQIISIAYKCLKWFALVCVPSAVFWEAIFGAEGTYGAVRDFIDVYTPQWRDTLPWGSHFPTFNVADSCISVGAVLLLITGFGEKEKDEAEAIAQTPEEG